MKNPNISFLIKVILLITVICFFESGITYSQWIPVKGKGGAIITLKYSEYNQRYDSTGKLTFLPLDGKYTNTEFNIYYATGISPKVGAYVKFGFAKKTFQNTLVNQQSFGITNPSIGLIYQVTGYPLPVSGIDVELVLPFYFPKDQQPPLGSDYFGVNASYLIGNGMRVFGMPSYYTAFVKYGFTGDPAGGGVISLGGTFGSSFNRYTSWYVSAEYAKGLDPYNFSSTKVSGAIIQKFAKNLSIALGTEYVVSGKNVLTGPAVFLALYTNY
ncbi:hypothetical protein BH10BAC5_BH10BAC5_07610 [soil metagenome]